MGFKRPEVQILSSRQGKFKGLNSLPDSFSFGWFGLAFGCRPQAKEESRLEFRFLIKISAEQSISLYYINIDIMRADQ